MIETPPTFAGLQGHSFINLTTYRKNGAPVVTTIWFALDGEPATARRAFAWTDITSGKAKRIRNNGQVLIAPATARGKPLGPEVPATARLLPDAETATAQQRMNRKYGLPLKFFAFLARRQKRQSTFVEFTALA